MSAKLPANLRQALPEPARVAEVKKELSAKGVKYVLSCWIDLHGNPKTKPVPLAEFEALCAGRGPQFAVHSISFVPELSPADSDQIPIPDLNSVVVCPWDKTCAWMFADLWWKDRPYSLCPRHALKRAIKSAADAGYVVSAGIEPEFVIMKWLHGRPVKAFDDDPQPGDGPISDEIVRPRRQAFGYDAEMSMDAMGFLGELMDTLNNLGWELHDVVAEGAYSQFELDFHYTDVLAMADRLVFLRMLIKEAAKKRGLFATFMPKPTTGDWRSGAHINHSITRIDAPTVNLFKDGVDFSAEARHAVAGILRHGGALTAIACPTVNSYNGLVARVAGLEGGTVTWAPTHITYGINNRSAMLRLPQSRFCIENRAADMCMNPYLALALTTAASVEGLIDQADPGPPSNIDLYTEDESKLKAAGIRPLPRNLLEAIELLRDDALAREVLGEQMLDSYLRYKTDEWSRYHQAVTDWETREYLRLY